MHSVVSALIKHKFKLLEEGLWMSRYNFVSDAICLLQYCVCENRQLAALAKEWFTIFVSFYPMYFYSVEFFHTVDIILSTLTLHSQNSFTNMQAKLVVPEFNQNISLPTLRKEIKKDIEYVIQQFLSACLYSFNFAPCLSSQGLYASLRVQLTSERYA